MTAGTDALAETARLEAAAFYGRACGDTSIESRRKQRVQDELEWERAVARNIAVAADISRARPRPRVSRATVEQRIARGHHDQRIAADLDVHLDYVRGVRADLDRLAS